MSTRLSVARAIVDDESTVLLEQSDMEAMGVAHGDVLLLTHGGRKTVAVAHLDESDGAQYGVARLSTIMRRNLHLDIDDDVTVTCLGSDVPNGKFIRVLPIDDTVDEVTLDEKLFDNYLQPYFADAFRPVQQGDLFLVSSVVSGGSDVEFVVVETDPKPYCIVGPKTDIFYKGEPIFRQDVL
ncbi:transitional endoplasmic reticulum ATPase [Phytophthora cinnamomi]|uniref:transitional endoplasmic reticulum ATPase n=1 Tax=Phytophthora cinnamomi TaxID=4785 RepID=UPI00355A5CB4|nr:transitional endoplasmic reticulum ATPase [Phytophthora cinnamomi]